MTEKEIRKLNRKDLLVLLAEQTARADKLEETVRLAEKKLMERNLVQEECGTMAEAAMKLNDVFRAADEAAAVYLENARQFAEKQEQICREQEVSSQKKSEEIIGVAESLLEERRIEAGKLMDEAKAQAAQILADAQKQEDQAKQRADEIVSEAEKFAAEERMKAEKLILDAQEQAAREMAGVDEKWNEIYARIQKMEAEYSWLQGIIHKNTGDMK